MSNRDYAENAAITVQEILIGLFDSGRERPLDTGPQAAPHLQPGGEHAPDRECHSRLVVSTPKFRIRVRGGILRPEGR